MVKTEFEVSVIKKSDSELIKLTLIGKESEICAGISDLINNAIKRDIVDIIDLAGIVSFAIDCLSEKNNIDKGLLMRALIAMVKI